MLQVGQMLVISLNVGQILVVLHSHLPSFAESDRITLGGADWFNFLFSADFPRKKTTDGASSRLRNFTRGERVI